MRDERGGLVSVDGDAVHATIVTAAGGDAIGTTAESGSENYRAADGLRSWQSHAVTSAPRGELELAATELVADRPFAAVARTDDDLEILHELAARLAERAADPTRPTGWQHWRGDAADSLLLVPSWERLETFANPAGVGFFGQLRPDPDGPFPPHLERSVAAAGARAGWLLAYFNVRFLEPAPDGARRYGNLVVIASREQARSLAHDADHGEALRLSSGAYRSIRIHRLELEGVATRRPAIRVRETLYLDFTDSPPWRAVRTCS